MRNLVLLLLMFCLPACDATDAPAGGQASPMKPDDWNHLRVSFDKLVTHARAEQPEKIMKILEGYLLNESELVELFGPTAGAQAWKGYGDVIAVDLRRQAPQVIIDKVKEGYTEVRVEQVGPTYPGRTTPGDKHMLEMMIAKRPMYTVRLRKPGGELGLRFNGFIYMEGGWRCLLKSYDFLPEPGEAPATQPTTQPASQPATQPASQPATQPAAQPTTQPAAQPTPSPAD